MTKKRPSDETIRRTIYRLHTYHKYWLAPGVRNPKVDRLSRLILDLKDENCPNHTNAVQYFGKRLSQKLVRLVDHDEEIYGAIVPSHEAGKCSKGLRAVMRHVRQLYNIKNSRNPLVRHTTVEKLSYGGDRDKEVHLNSIRIAGKFIPSGAKVLLLDDITTTNNSLNACAELLYDSGARLVMKVALAKTADD